jgi:serine/threonine-protein kinase
MGSVYLAWHAGMAIWVAVKQMRLTQLEPAVRDTWSEQFRSEARILNRLHHPGLPRVYDFFAEQDSQFLVMEFVDGRTLLDAIKAAPPEEADVLKWARELCDVLEYLHRHNPPVIFKDLKPTNVMLAKDGSLRLIDFGIAKMAAADGEAAATDALVKGWGSDGFAPIEQYGQMGRTDPRSDIYALGATLYFALAGHTPTSAPDRLVERAGGKDSLPSLTHHRPGLSERLVSTIEWMMQLTPQARPATIAEVSEAMGLAPVMAPPRDSAPARIRQLIGEQFHFAFPSPSWFPRDRVPLAEAIALMGVSPPIDGRAPLLAISGDAGCGKSRILAEIRRVAQENLEILPLVQGTRLYRRQPFGALLPTMRMILRNGGAALLSEVAGKLEANVLHEASTALPELKPVVPGVAFEPRTPADMIRSLVEVMLAILTASLGSKSGLLAIDDGQWLDEATVRFLDHMRHGAVGGKLALAVACRAEDGEEPIKTFLDGWCSPGESLRLEAVPLEKEELEPYVEALLPRIHGFSAHASEVHALTGGNPFFLEELLRLLVVRRIVRESQGVLVAEGFELAHMPLTPEDAVQRRLEHLPQDAQNLLSMASVIGLRFSAESLEQLSGEPQAVLRESLQRGREGCFVRISEDSGQFEFVSEATRTVFYERLKPAEQAKFHRTLGIMEDDRGTRTGTATHSELHFSLAGELDQALDTLARFDNNFLSPRNIGLILGEMPQPKTWDASRPLTASQEKSAVNALNTLTRTMRSQDSFGGGTHVSAMARGSLVNLMLPLLADVGPLTLICNDSEYTLNGRVLAANQAPTDLHQILSRQKLSGFQLRPGLTDKELLAWVDVMGRPRDVIQRGGGWTATLQQAGLTHITVSEMIYVGVSETELFDPSKLSELVSVAVRPSEAAPPEKPTRPEGPADLDTVADMLRDMRAEHAGEAEMRARLEAVQAVLHEMQASAGSPAVARIEPPVPLPVRQDGGQMKLRDDIRTLATSLQANSVPDHVVRLLSLVQDMQIPLAAFLERTPEMLLEDLSHSDEDICLAASAALAAMGRKSVPALVTFMGKTADLKLRTRALTVLLKACPDTATVLARRVQECTHADESARLLECMEVARLPWESSLSMLLRNPAREVRRQAYAFLHKSTLGVPEKLTLLQELLGSESPTLIADAARWSGMMRHADMVGPLAKMLSRSFDRPEHAVEVYRQVCHALGKIGGEAALPILRAAAFPGLMDTAVKKDPDVRSAAIWGLGRLPGDEAHKLLQRAERDRDPTVQSAAKTALEARDSQLATPDTLAELEAY